MINVAKAYLPPLEEYLSLIKPLWEDRIITNGGRIERKLIKNLKKYLQVDNLTYTANATLGLQLSIKALELKGEIITTPFSYVATTSAIVWENCKPVFADIESDTLCIDPGKIEKAITKKTTAILATHVYGNPCDVVAIEKIAKRRKLKVIYDSAHAFGVKYKGKSIFKWGDVSVVSFHATKIFHTGQGGGVITKQKRLHKIIDYMNRFGHKTPTDFYGLGINCRNSELHAALGLCQIPLIGKFISKRKRLSECYDEELAGLDLKRPLLRRDVFYNYAYYPIIFNTENKLLKTMKILRNNSIFPRRYFHPSLDRLKYVNSPTMPISNGISRRVLCLPLYYELNLAQVRKISRLIIKSLG